MQLAGIKISNLFSFPYLPDLENAQEVTFHNTEKENVNVLIGPNGAGKSKFLEIIRDILQNRFMKDYIVDLMKLSSKDPKILQSIITKSPNPLPKVYAHFATPHKPSEVSIRLTLTVHDYENLRFLCDHIEDINYLISVYSTLNHAFAPMTFDKLSLKHDTITFHCMFDIAKQELHINRDLLSDTELFVLEYLSHIELIQICVDIHNKIDTHTAWMDLHNTFAVLGFDRNMEDIPTYIRPDAWERYMFKKHTSKYSAYVAYALCIHKIWKFLMPDIVDLTPETIQTTLQNFSFFVSLSAVIKKYFNKQLLVSYREGLLGFSFADDRNVQLMFSDLSDGEQSLLTMIFTIYGYDLKGGLLIIDEPEIHFHPQMQRSLSRMMEKISDNIGTQFILSTYSPLFINESNISNVYRFAKVDGSTSIRNPSIALSDDEASLVHLLKFENMSKIFFVNKIIMVEGETDAYFFDFYLKYLHTVVEWKEKITDYEIININGKGSYKLWKKFLSRFGITSYFIGDRDNTVDYGFLTQDELTYYYKQARAYFPKAKKKLARGSHYNKLVLTIRDLFSAKYNDLLGHIDELYQDNVFLLKRGDIETYLPLREKGLEYTVAFCHHDFQKWLNDKVFEPYRKEFDAIIKHIFS